MPASRQKAMPIIRVELIEDDGDWSKLKDAEAVVTQAADAVAQEMGGRLAAGVVTVALSSDAHVAALNKRFRNKDKPTNVLSFPAGGGAAPGYLGDIVIAAETVEREAAEQDLPLRHHLQHLVVHGILHLLGFDHIDANDAERMEALEIKILSRIGIANPYTGALETGTNE
jgi:probable rRNA maturation factor